MTIMIRLDDHVVATVGATRAYLAPQIKSLPADDRKRLTVEYMCQWALASADDRGGRVYTDHHALQFAQWRMRRDDAGESEGPR